MPWSRLSHVQQGPFTPDFLESYIFFLLLNNLIKVLTVRSHSNDEGAGEIATLLNRNLMQPQTRDSGAASSEIGIVWHLDFFM